MVGRRHGRSKRSLPITWYTHSPFMNTTYINTLSSNATFQGEVAVPRNRTVTEAEHTFLQYHTSSVEKG